jgi:1-acyl-sn-glycerol-3-phosphate acyltransferase
MPHLRALLFTAAFFLLTGLMGVLALPLLALPRALAVRATRLWARIVLALLAGIVGLRFRIDGAQHLPRSGPALIAAKHQSAFDTIVWLALLPDAAYVLKRELLAIPVYGWFCRKLGMIAVDRGAGASAMRGLLRDAEAALAAGRQVVIFPEGTRTAPGTTVRYQPGVAGLYQRAGLPIVPVGTDSGRFWGRRALLKHPGCLRITVLPPIPPGLPREIFLTRLREAIESASLALLLPDPGDKPGDTDL